MKNLIIRYGLYSLALLVVLGLLNWLVFARIGYTLSEIAGYLSMIIALLAIYYGIKRYRDEQLDGQISFGKALGTGLLITLIPAVGFFIYSWLFFILQGDAFLKWAEQSMSHSEWTNYQQQMEQMPDWATAPWFQGIVMFATVFAIGFVISLISAYILKERKEGKLA